MNPLIVALDLPEVNRADELAGLLVDVVGGFKVGLELLMGQGPSAIERIASHGLPVFVDAKLHDIPNTVLNASRQIAAAGARWVTVHSSGGVEMIEAANSGMGNSGVLAVTILTSIEESTLPALGLHDDLNTQIASLVTVASRGHAEGIVCAPGEARVAKAGDSSLTVFTPGIRPAGADHHDQQRVATPTQAMAAGADYIVVGRPITCADDVALAAVSILEEISPCHPR